MFRNLFFAVTVLIFGSVAASADISNQFTFNVDYCSNPCLGGGTGGTVTVSQTTAQASAGIVDVLVQLASGLDFHDGNPNNSNGLHSFAFNMNVGGTTPNPTLTLVTGALANDDIEVLNGPANSWNFTSSSNHDDGAGTFDYRFDCASSNGNDCTNPTPTLEFQVKVTGLLPVDFETTENNTSNVDFAADVTNSNNGGTACTGMIGAGNGTGPSTASVTTGGCAAPGQQSVTPEPTSIVLLGSALILVGTLLKKRLAV
jgi:hypothetical protein